MPPPTAHGRYAGNVAVRSGPDTAGWNPHAHPLMRTQRMEVQFELPYGASFQSMLKVNPCCSITDRAIPLPRTLVEVRQQANRRRYG